MSIIKYKDTMTRILLTIFIFSFVSSVNSQTDIKDYNLLDIILPTLAKEGHLYIYEDPSAFVDKRNFFTKSFLCDYTHPTIGVDSKKIRRLIKKLDFNYLSSQESKFYKWDLTKIKFPVTKYIGNPLNNFDKIRRLKISRPIYSEDLKIAFIYYQDICGYIGCGSASVIVLKKHNGRWKKYLTIPIFIS